MTQPALTTEPLPIVDYYTILRSQIEHEDNLITQRISWFLASQSFLFTAYAIVVTSAPGNYVQTKSDLLWAIPVISIIAALLILITIAAGLIAMGAIRKQFIQFSDKARSYNLPSIQGLTITRLMGMAARILLPMVFILAWLIIVIRQKS